MIQYLKLFAASSAILFLLNCRGKDGATGPKGENIVQEIVKTGSSSGYVHLLDEFGKLYSKGDSGVVVTLSGSEPEIAVRTDKNGRFLFSNVKTGNYNLILKKEGFPDHQYPNFMVVEGPKPLANLATISMSKQSTTVLSKLTLSLDSLFGSKYVKLKVNVSPTSATSQPRTVLFVFSNSPEVSINDVNSSYAQFSKAAFVIQSAISDSAVVSINYFLNSFNLNTYYDVLVAGKTVYCKAYAIVKTDAYSYYDSENRRIFPSLSNSVSPTVSIRLN